MKISVHFIAVGLLFAHHSFADRLCPPSRVVQEINVAETRFFSVPPPVVATLRRNHWAALPTEHIEINLDQMMEAYRAFYVDPTHPPRPGDRMDIDLPIAPAGSNQPLQITPELRGALNAWVAQVLATARAAYPDEDLVAGNATFGVGWNAASSWIHRDLAGTYMHATFTVKEDSTIVVLPSGVAKLTTNQSGIQNRIVGRDEAGNLTVEVISVGRDRRVLRTVILGPEDYEQPPTRQTIVFSGIDHQLQVPGVEAAYHASPVSTRQVLNWERATFFVDLFPRRLLEGASP